MMHSAILARVIGLDEGLIGGPYCQEELGTALTTPGPTRGVVIPPLAILPFMMNPLILDLRPTSSVGRVHQVDE